MDMTTKVDVSGSGGGGGGGGGVFDNARGSGSGRLRDLNNSRDGRDRQMRDGREPKARDRDTRNGKAGHKSSGGRDGEAGHGGGGRRDRERAEEEGEGEGGKEEAALPFREWLDVVHHKDVDVARIIHVDVQWLLCSAAKVTKFVTGLEGCAHDLQLQLVKAPTYARVPGIHTHPLVTHPYIELPRCSSAQEERDILLRVQNHMVDSHDYVRCCDVATDWKSYGLTVPSPKMDLSGKILTMPLPKGRAFMHRTGAVFVRVAPGGLVLLPNVHWRDNGEHADQPPGRNRQLQKRLRDTLNNLVVVTHSAHTVANSVVREAVDNVLSHIAEAR
ncbi:unnamed protein product [Hapterophycus canaliculatus]